MSNAIAATNYCAATLGVSPGAAFDTHAIRQRFETVHAQRALNLSMGMTPGQAIAHTLPMIPGQTAVNGAMLPGRAREVTNMIGCVGTHVGLHPGVTGELMGMYGDAVRARAATIALDRRRALGY